MRVKLQTNSMQAWDSTLLAIKNAEHSIYIEMYIFSEDTDSSHQFVAALCDRAQSGVQVIMILDAFGSMGLKQKTISLLTNAGVEIRFFRHWIHRTHRKTIIIDGAEAFVGGVNITKHAAHWADLQIQVTGVIVERLVKVFSRTYKLSGGTKTLLVPAKYAMRKHRVRMWILEHTPVARRRTLRKYYLQKLKEAHTKIIFVTPYFVPHRWLIKAMRHATERGVVVEVLIPEKTDSKILDAINRYYITQILREKIVVYQTKGTNHAKAVLIDQTEGLVGSANIDTLSFERNNELGIFFTDPITVLQLSTIITQWKNEGKKLTREGYTIRWYHKFVAYVLKLIHPFL